MEILGALHHFAAYECSLCHAKDLDCNSNDTNPFCFIGKVASVLLLGGYLVTFQGIGVLKFLLHVSLSSPYTFSQTHAFISADVDVVELIRYLTGQEYLGKPVDVNPMATLVSSENGGRYEEAEVTITFKQGELVKYVSGQPSPLPEVTTAFNPSLLLRCGSTGNSVFQLQERLERLGFLQHEPTGYFGELTEEAIIQFQLANNLVADGIVGTQTLHHLSQLSDTQTAQNSASSNDSPSEQFITDARTVPAYTVAERSPNSAAFETEASIGRELYLGSQGIAVQQLQTLLKQTGNYNGPVTGYFGNLTTQAIKDFQSKHQLPVTGIVGVKTFLALADEMN